MFEIGCLKNDIHEILDNLEYEVVEKIEYRNKHRIRIEYINLPMSIDIEASSFYTDGANTYTNEFVYDHMKIGDTKTISNLYKASTMYIWQIGINGYAIIGRTWNEFRIAITEIKNFFHLNFNRRVVFYIHNLGYEFQWFRKMFDWDSIFARETRKPLKCVSKSGIELRCSYMLSGMSLEKTCENLVKYKVTKKVGDLDYRLIRHSNTVLSDKEIGYAIYDVIGVCCYIQEQIEMYGDITKIPLTNTGRVRNLCKDICFNDKNKKYYRQLMKELQITSVDEYQSLKRAFQGGFTHASVLKSGKTYTNVESFDFTSSYPTVMVAEMFPMSMAKHYDSITLDQYQELTKNYLLVFDIEFDWLHEKIPYEHALSESKCFEKISVCADNGRIISAQYVKVTLTNIHFDFYQDVYTWENCRISNVYVYKKMYLPTPFVSTILDLYEKKTVLKGVDGKEVEYLNSKGMCNSTYGMTVQDILTDEIFYDNDLWAVNKYEGNNDIINEQIQEYNNSRNRFLFYPWGVFITAYAQRNLWLGIREFKEDYIYSDTDSLKVLNKEKHMQFIENYNQWILSRLKKACDYHKIDYSKICPKTIKGVEKPLGVWDDEGKYEKFKTLGAKRYLVEEDEKCTCTIAGVNKKKTSEWLTDKDNPFETFQNDMTVPKDYSGRLISTYIDYKVEGTITDYLGNTNNFKELSAIHMEPTDYNLTLSPIYMMLISGKEEQSTWD